MKRTSRSLLWIALSLAAAATIGSGIIQPAYGEQKPAPPKKISDPFLSGPPLTLDQVRRLLQEDAIPPRRRKEAIQSRGVGFAISPETMDKLKAAGATDEILQLIQNKAHPAVAVSTTPAPAPKPQELGGLAVTCDPAECQVSLNGKARGSSQGGVMELAGIAAGRWVVDVSKDGYLSRQNMVTVEADKTARITTVLEPTAATEEALGAALFQKVVEALGGESGLKQLASVQATGSTTIARDGNSVRWTLLMRNRPDRALFQARAGAILHEVGFVGNEFMASKNLKGQDAMELPTDFGFIRDNQLPAFIARLRNPRYKLVAKHTMPVSGEEFHLFAEAGTEKIAIGLDAALRPQRVRITTETGVGSATITYDDYFNDGNAPYPKTMRIKPDGRTRGIEVRFDTVELNTNLKDGDYKLHGKPLPGLIN
jgi:hypothetical protein